MSWRRQPMFRCAASNSEKLYDTSKSSPLPSSSGRDVSSFMAAYYQGEREMPPIEKTMATPCKP